MTFLKICSKALVRAKKKKKKIILETLRKMKEGLLKFFKIYTREKNQFFQPKFKKYLRNVLRQINCSCF